jgi:hypothetical protein
MHIEVWGILNKTGKSLIHSTSLNTFSLNHSSDMLKIFFRNNCSVRVFNYFYARYC